MNGRIYDPTLGRFLQADPFIQAPKNSQSYNRYSYVLNNPLSYTDPSGYFHKKIGKFFKKWWKPIVAIVAAAVTYGAASGWAAGWGLTASTVQVSGTIYGSAFTLSTTSLSVGGYMAAGAIAGAVGGAVGGALVTGSLKGALRGAFTGAIAGAAGGFANAGAVTGWGDAAQRVAVSALGGCGVGKASGGSCSKGAKMAAMTQALTMTAEAIYKYGSQRISKRTGKPYNNTGKVHIELEGISDTGKQVDIVNTDYWGMSDQAGVMKDLGRKWYVDAFAEFHDGLHDTFTSVLGKGDVITNNPVGLVATMPHSYGLTLLAASRPYNYAYTSFELMNDE